MVPRYNACISYRNKKKINIKQLNILPTGLRQAFSFLEAIVYYTILIVPIRILLYILYIFFIIYYPQVSDPKEVFSGNRVADKPLTEDQMIGETLAIVLGDSKIWSAGKII